MSNQSVSIYLRPQQGAFLHCNAVTDMGVMLASPPFVHVPLKELPDNLWTHAKALLSRVPTVVPHPATFDQMKPLYSLASCNSWKHFAENAVYCDITKVGNEIQITPGMWDGTGFSESNADALRFDVDDPNISKVLLGCLESNRER